jgi:hypothetical protein
VADGFDFLKFPVSRVAVGETGLIPDCSQRVAQAFQPMQAQAKACGYRK